MQLELDARDLMVALRATPMLYGKQTWDPLEKIVVGSSYHLVDEEVVLCIQDVQFLQPFRGRLLRRDYATFQFTQSGAYRLHGDGQVRKVRSGSVRLNAIPETISEAPAATSLRGASVFLPRDRLIDCFGLRPDLWPEGYRAALFKEHPSVSMEMPLTPDMWLALDAILGCSFEEPLRSLYLGAKTVELLSLSVMQFNGFALPGAAAGLGQQTREQRLIEAAAHIYQMELSHPPSIDMLSRRVGLNRNKLTAGFRSGFGMTPAEYSRQVRLKWAARRLSEGLNIRQVAAEVGYDSVAAFGRAFRQHYERTPSEQVASVKSFTQRGSSI